MTSMWSPTGDELDRLDAQGYGRGPASRKEMDRSIAADVQRASKDKERDQ